MKELDDFTVERLQAFIDKPLDNGFTRDEQMALVRIALAAKTAEPVAEVRLGDYDDDGWCPDAAPHILIDGPDWANFPEGFKLYAAPVLNSPELPDGWIPCAERMPEVGELVLIYTRHIEMIVASLDADGFFATSEGTCYHPDSVVLWQPAPTPPTTDK